MTGDLDIVVSVVSRLPSSLQNILKESGWEEQESRAGALSLQCNMKKPDYPNMKCYFCQKDGYMARHCCQKKADMEKNPAAGNGHEEGSRDGKPTVRI